MEKKIAVYCSSSRNIDPKLNEVARQFIRAASSHGYVIVSGGTVKGMMDDICVASSECGGRHIGIIPKMMKELANPLVDELVVADDMSQRKALMRKDTLASVALPGGIGTLDEIIEALTLKKLGLYDGKIILFNYEGFYDPLLALLRHYEQTGMMGHDVMESVHAPSTVEGIMELLG